MKEPHSEGVANHADLESCAGDGDIAGEALTEALAGRLLSREIPRFGCRPCGQKGKAISTVALSQAAGEPGAVGDPVHVRKLPAREPGDLGGACREVAGRWGRRKPHAPRVRRRGVGPGRSTREGSEQGRATVGGGSGGKGRDRGERRRVRHGPHTEADRPCPKRWTACGAEAVVGLALTPLSEVRAV